MAEDNTTGGWGVAVWTTRMGGGPPMLVIYGAAIPDKEDAKKLVEGLFASMPGERVGEAYPLAASTFEALGIRAGEATLL